LQIGQIPWLDHFFDKNPIYHLGPAVFGPSITFALEKLAIRRKETDKGPGDKPNDMLDMYLEAQKQYPDIVDEQTLLAYLMANVAAGSDTVATALRAVIYQLCRNSEAMARLKKELDDVRSSPEGLTLPITWSDCQNRLPYLDACVREGLRLCPGIALCLERVVPPQGFSLSDGRFFPGGTVVGINPYVMNRHEGTFGADSDEFRPERWLKAADETEETFRQRLTNMRETEFTFGHGKRQCSGRNLAWLEVYKLIGTLLLTFDVKLADPNKEWKTVNHWFMKQSEMDMVFERRM
jgi:cytochrome P450